MPGLGRARQTAVAHGRVEDSGWTWYVESEAWFVAGEWDKAVAAGVQAMDIGEANAYRRLTVRTVHVMVPIAAVRGDRALIERAQGFYESLVGRFEFPDSPYSRIIRAAQDLEIAAADLLEPFVPEVEPRIVAFEDEPGGGSWSAAVDRVFRSWLEAGELDGAARALATMTEAVPRFKDRSQLGRGSYELLRARLAAAQGDRETAAAAGRLALEKFRQANAPWWMAKAIRLLERAGAADYGLVGQAFEIERRLGALAPRPEGRRTWMSAVFARHLHATVSAVIPAPCHDRFRPRICQMTCKVAPLAGTQMPPAAARVQLT